MENELKQIIIKVRDLYHKYGIKSMTMDDVSKELGISKKTLYQYVQNKDELVTKVCEVNQDEIDGYFEKIKSKNLNAIQSLMWVNKLILKLLKEHNHSIEYDLRKYHPEVFFKLRVEGSKRMFESVLSNIIQGKKEGLYRKNVDENIITKLYVSRIENLTGGDLITREDMMNPDFTFQIMEYHIRGIANEKGIIEYEQIKKKFDKENKNIIV